MKSIAFCAHAAGILAWTIAVESSVVNIFGLLFLLPESASGLPWLIFWIIGTFGPLALSALAWVVGHRAGTRWLPHLLFIPASILSFLAGIWAFKQTVGITIDDMKEADALILGLGYLFLALFVHITAVGNALVRTMVQMLNQR